MEPVTFIATYKWVFVFFHVFSVVGAMGSALSIDYLTAYFARNRVFSRSELKTLHVLIRAVTIGLASIVVSGTLIFLSNPEGYLASSKFITKMGVVAVLCINGFLLHYTVFRHLDRKKLLTAKKHAALRARGFIFGAVSLISWSAALLLALQPSIPFSASFALSLYAGTLVCGGTLAYTLSRWYA